MKIYVRILLFINDINDFSVELESSVWCDIMFYMCFFLFNLFLM